MVDALRTDMVAGVYEFVYVCASACLAGLLFLDLIASMMMTMTSINLIAASVGRVASLQLFFLERLSP